MKRVTVILMILMIAFSIFAMNTMVVFAEEEVTEEISKQEELAGLFDDLGGALSDLADEFVAVFDSVVEFITSDETYSSIAGVILAVLAVIFVPILIAILVIVYLIIAAVMIVTSALGQVVGLILKVFSGVSLA